MLYGLSSNLGSCLSKFTNSLEEPWWSSLTTVTFGFLHHPFRNGTINFSARAGLPSPPVKYELLLLPKREGQKRSAWMEVSFALAFSVNWLSQRSTPQPSAARQQKRGLESLAEASASPLSSKIRSSMNRSRPMRARPRSLLSWFLRLKSFPRRGLENAILEEHMLFADLQLRHFHRF